MDASDVVDMVFTIQGDGVTSRPFEISYSNLVFNNKPIKKMGTSNALTAFPNPASEMTELAFELPTRGKTVVQLTSAQGKNVIQVTEEFAKERNKVTWELKRSPSGMYVASVITATGKMTTKVMIP